MLPNLIIAGVPKAGTSSLHKWLSDHPSVFGSQIKELQFFMDRESSVFRKDSNCYDNPISEYHKHFSAFNPEKQQIALEATPGYIYQDAALKEMPKHIPDIKIIFVLRNPTDRFISIFNYFQNNVGILSRNISLSKFISDSLDNSITYNTNNEFISQALKHGIYYSYLEKWLQVIKKENILILRFEDLMFQKKETLEFVSKYLNIKSSFYDRYDFPAENKTYTVRNHFIHSIARSIRGRIPQSKLRDLIRNVYRNSNTKASSSKQSTSQEDILKLIDYYKSHNKRLNQLYGINTDDWNSSKYINA